MAITVRKGRLAVAVPALALILLASACGLKSSALDNLKQAGGPVSGVAGGAGTSAVAGGSGAAGVAGGGATGAPGAGSAPGAAGGTSSVSGSGPAAAGGAAGGVASGPVAAGAVTAPGTCATTGGDTTGVTKTTINVGLHAPLTGTGTPFPNSSFVKGSQVFFDQPGHEICGRKVHVDFQDDTYTPQGANRVCDAFSRTDFLAIGGAGTDQIQACATNSGIQRTQTPYLSAGVTDNGLTGLKNYFAVSLTYRQQGSIVAKNALAQGFGRPAPSTDSKHKQWAVVTGASGNFDSATQGITKALDQAGISYDVTRFDQNSGNYDNAANQLGQSLALSGYKTIFVDAAPGVFIFMVKGYYGAAPTGNGVHWTGPGVTFTDFLVAQYTCQVSANAISGAADFLAPNPGIDRATADFKQAFSNSYDDIEWSLWGLDQAVFAMLQKSSGILTRQNFIASTLGGSFNSGVFAPAVFNGSHFGGTGAWVQRVDCSKNDPNQPSGPQGNGYWNTVGMTYLRP